MTRAAKCEHRRATRTPHVTVQSLATYGVLLGRSGHQKNEKLKHQVLSGSTLSRERLLLLCSQSYYYTVQRRYIIKNWKRTSKYLLYQVSNSLKWGLLC